jgi:site-specific DNA-methyltransferase (cytosine-N4-specific)
MRTQRLFKELDREDRPSDPQAIKFDLDSFKDKNYLTHNFHPYPAKFVPHIPRLVIENLTAVGETVLDPFCGSGTSLVEASLLKRRSVGFDINPIAGLIARVKTSSLSRSEIDTVSHVVRELNRMSLAVARGDFGGLSPDVPEFLNRDHWFQSGVQQELGIVRRMIWSVSEERARDFLKVAFSAILVRASNQDSETRWVAVEKPIQAGDALRAFLMKAGDMLKRIREYGSLDPVSSEVCIDSVSDSETPADASVDLIVTSPPYLNSFDYYLYHKLRFFWLGLDHYSVQARELGSRHRHCDKNEGIETYESGIKAILDRVVSSLKPQRYLCIVIGDSILKGELIRMDEIYQRLCAGPALSHVHTYSYDQRKYTTAFTRNFKSAFKRTHIMFFQRS